MLISHCILNIISRNAGNSVYLCHDHKHSRSFDGKHSLALDEPVDLPVGTPLRVHVESIPVDAAVTANELLAPVIVGLHPTLSQAIATAPEFASENM